MGIEVHEKEVNEMLGFIFEWVGSQLKASEIKKWGEETKQMLVEAILEPSKWFVKAMAVGNETFDRIHDLVKKSFEKRKIQSGLEEIYDERKEESLRHIELLIKTFQERSFGPKKAKQLRILRKMPKMKETLQKVERHARQATQNRPNRKKALQSLDLLLIAKAWVESRTLPFSEMDFTRKVGGDEPILEISYKIWKPDFLYSPYQFEDEYQDFPLKWLGSKLTVWAYEYLYQRWKEGENLDQLLESSYDGTDAFEMMRAKCRSNHLGFRRVPLLEEIIGNYQDQRYASVITLALTQIEGFIWDLAILLHNIGLEKIFDQEKVGFGDHRGSKLMDERGILIEAEPTVGLLIRCTRIKQYLYAPFLDYCTNELFRERNPVLHGRIIKFGTKLEANKKLLALEMVVSALHDILVKKADVFLRHLLGEHFQKFEKSLHNGNRKEAFDLLKRVLRARRLR